MLAILFGVLSLVLAGGLAIVLPILAWARMARLERELRELRAQLHALEHRGLQGAARPGARTASLVATAGPDAGGAPRGAGA